jgi:hypothetical protein
VFNGAGEQLLTHFLSTTPYSGSHRAHRADLHVSVRIRRALGSHVPRLLRTNARGIRRARGAWRAALEADLVTLIGRPDRGGATGIAMSGEYLETVITR